MHGCPVAGLIACSFITPALPHQQKVEEHFEVTKQRPHWVLECSWLVVLKEEVANPCQSIGKKNTTW